VLAQPVPQLPIGPFRLQQLGTGFGVQAEPPRSRRAIDPLPLQLSMSATGNEVRLVVVQAQCGKHPRSILIRRHREHLEVDGHVARPGSGCWASGRRPVGKQLGELRGDLKAAPLVVAGQGVDDRPAGLR
jgi:hypothetical protein